MTQIMEPTSGCHETKIQLSFLVYNESYMRDWMANSTDLMQTFVLSLSN